MSENTAIEQENAKYKTLADLLVQEHGLVLTNSELQDIVNVVLKMQGIT